MNCIIADDEPLARKRLENFLNEIPFLSLKASCANAMEVMLVLHQNEIDLLFLDIQMPKMTGITLLKTIAKPPLTIITTAFPNHALEGYELDVTDYLLKPFSFERFVIAVNKGKKIYDLSHESNAKIKSEEEFFFVKHNKVFEKISFTDILYIEGLQNYVLIHTADRKYTVYLSLKSMEDKIPASLFLKISRSYIVNLAKITRMDSTEIILNTTHLPIGRSYKDKVMSIILNPYLIRR